MVTFDEIDHADEDVVDGHFRFGALEFPQICRVLKGDDFRVVRDHVVLGPCGFGVVVGVDDFVETNPATRFDSGNDGSIDEVFAGGI